MKQIRGFKKLHQFGEIVKWKGIQIFKKAPGIGIYAVDFFPESPMVELWKFPLKLLHPSFKITKIRKHFPTGKMKHDSRILPL
jgi:hypothetical protein